MALPTFSNRFFRDALSRVALPLLLLFTANSVFAQAYSFRVTQGGTRDPLSESPVPIIAGNPFEVRVAAFEKGAPDDEPYKAFNRDVILSIRGNYMEETVVFVPKEAFLDGVAEFVEISSSYAGSGNMHISVTDGNIVTDNASGYFSIAPARFEVSYVGTGDYNLVTLNAVPAQPIAAHDVVAGQSLFLRVRAVNADPLESTATGYTGELELTVNDPTSPIPVATAFGTIRAGGFTDSVLLFIPSAGEGLTISVVGTNLPPELTDIQDLIDLEGVEDIGDIIDLEDYFDPGHPVVTENASGPFDVLPAAGGADLTVDNLELRGRVLPGSSLTLRYRLNNGTEADIEGPVDVTFRLMDGTTILSTWTERFEGTIPFEGDDTTSGNLFTSFVLPVNLTANNYTLQIRPNGDENQGTQSLDISGLRPNLYVEDFQFTPGEYRGGDAMRFKLVFSNYPSELQPPGRATTATPLNQEYRVQIHLSTNNVFGDDDDFLVWEDWFIGGSASDDTFVEVLSPGQQVHVDSAMFLPNHFDGTYYLLARVNSGPGRDGVGTLEEYEGSVGSTPTGGDNTTYAYESQKLTILPNQATDTYRVSLTSGGGESDGVSDNPDISADGRYIAFDSFGSLAGSVAAGTRNIFVRDTLADETILVSVAPENAAADGNSGHPSISADGRYVAFQSEARNLVADDTNGRSDVFVRDLLEGTTLRVSLNPNPVGPSARDANHGSQLASISADGRYIVFESSATNLVTPVPPGLVLGRTQIYLFDRDVAGTGVYDTPGNTSITLVSQSGGFAGTLASTKPAISSDGSYVVFETNAPNLLGENAAYTQVVRWARDTKTLLPISIGTDGLALADNHSGSPAINGNGEYIAFVSRAQNLTAHYDPLTGEGDRYLQSIPHIFRARIQGGVVSEIIRMNAASGAEPNNPLLTLAPDLGGYEPSLSDDGRFLAFTSESENLLPPISVRNLDRTHFEMTQVENYRDDNNVADVYLYDLLDPENPLVRRASISRFGYGATDVALDDPGGIIDHRPLSRRPAVSPDGRYVAFTSDAKEFNGLVFGATNFDFEATNSTRDVYVFDLKTTSEHEEEDDRLFSTRLTAGQSKAAVGEAILFNLEITDPAPEIANVQLFGNGVLIAQMTRNGRIWSWQGGIENPGEWHFYAVITDGAGNVVYSETVRVDVRMLRLKVSGNTVNLGSSVSLELVVEGGAPVIGYVDFFANGQRLQRDSQAPFGMIWTPTEIGRYTLSFTARNTAASRDLFGEPVTVTVQAPVTPFDFTWIDESGETGAHLSDLVHSPHGFLTVGAGGTVLTSDDRSDWTSGALPTSHALNGIASGGGVLVAVGDGGGAFLSEEGDDWVPLVAQTGSRLTGVAYGDGVFVAVGDGGRIRTLDPDEEGAGGAWIARTSGTAANLHAITYGNGQFVAVGQGGIILLSPDGIDWSAAGSVAPAPLYSVTYGNGIYVAVGGDWDQVVGSYRALVLTSSNGTTWAHHDPGIGRILHGVAFGGGHFAAVGGGGTVALSIDGAGWLEQTTPITTTLASIAYGGGEFVAVGRDGTILRSESVSAENWLATYYSVEERKDPDVGTFGADPGGFGIPNLLRYAFALDAFRPDRDGLPHLVVTADGEGVRYPAISYTRNAEADDLEFVLEESTDLRVWSPVPDPVIVSVTTDGDLETTVIRSSRALDSEGTRGFLRLRVKVVP